MDLPASSKSEMAYQFLLKQLIEAKIPPEAPLRIPALGKESGLGVTPMREALRRLESERFVVMENNRGFRAAAVTQAELMDLEGCRLVIETALLREAIAAIVVVSLLSVALWYFVRRTLGDTIGRIQRRGGHGDDSTSSSHVSASVHTHETLDMPSEKSAVTPGGSRSETQR